MERDGGRVRSGRIESCRLAESDETGFEIDAQCGLREEIEAENRIDFGSAGAKVAEVADENS